MSTADFIQEAKTAGFSDAQTVLLIEKFEERTDNLVTNDKLSFELSKISHDLTKMKLGLYIAGFAALIPFYAKLLGVY